MSDKKKGFNEPPASKAPSKTLPKAGSFCKRLEECFRSMKTLEKDSEGLADYGKLVDEHAALKKEVVAKAQATEALRAQKDEEIAKLVAETKDLTVRKDVLFDEFHKKGREFDGRLTETRNLEDQIRRLQNELAKSKQEYDALNEECRDIQADLNNQKMQLREGENWRAEAEESRAQVSRLERQAAEGQLHSVDLQGLYVPVTAPREPLLTGGQDRETWNGWPRTAMLSSWTSSDLALTLELVSLVIRRT